jgi:hypothetical protein
MIYYYYYYYYNNNNKVEILKRKILKLIELRLLEILRNN